MFKKGSLSLSINAIVVLILAVTMLGLGLLFMNNMMGSSMDQLSSVADSIKDQMIERIRSGNEKLVFDSNDFEVKRSGQEEYYYGVLNQLQQQESFHIYFGCDDAMSDEEMEKSTINEYVDFDYIPRTIPLGKNEIDVQKVLIRVSPQAKATTYRCAIFIGDDESPVSEVSRSPENAGDNFESLTAEDAQGTIYAERYFFVSVD